MGEDVLVELVAERPVAGGRMLARHDGKVVFVAGAIPGERVRVRIERVQRQASWATAVEILEASRRPTCIWPGSNAVSTPGPPFAAQ